MMSEHLFLLTPASPVPDRWTEAFAQGRALEASALLDWVRSHDVSHSLLWLSTANSQWAQHLKELMQLQPAARVLVLSNAPDPREGLLALNGGARGYTHAYAVPALLQEVALVVAHGGLWVGPDLMQRLVSSTSAALVGRAAITTAKTSKSANTGTAASSAAAPADVLALLSAREAEVARAVSVGRSNKEVAELLHISERTVKAHLGVVFEKLGVRDRLQLVLRLSGPAESGATHQGSVA